MLYLVKSGKIPGMNKPVPQAVYDREFRKRVKAARELAGLSAQEVADRLDITKDQYLRYESRYMMRHHLIRPFCDLVGIDPLKLIEPPRQHPRHRRSA